MAKSRSVDRFGRIVAVILAGILLYLPFHTFISTWGGSAFGGILIWKSAKDILLFGLLGAVIVRLLWRGTLQFHLRQRLEQLILAYALITLGSAVLAWQGAQTAAGILMNLRYLVAFSIAVVVARHWPLTRQQTLQFLGWVGVLQGALGLIQVLLPASFLTLFGYSVATVSPFVTVDQNPDFLRAFATMSGPNDYGAYLIIGLLAGLATFRNKLWLVLTGLGIVLSYSRSAWIGVVVALVVYLFMQAEGRAAHLRRFGYGLVGLGIAGVLLVAVALQVPALRLAIFHSSPDDSSLIEGSTLAHLIETTSGVWRVMTHPLGCGVGCSGPASLYGEEAKVSENYYVQIAEEVGIVGLGLWLAIFGSVMVQLWQQRRDELARVLFASGCGLAVIGLFLHVWADDPLSITWWVLAGLAIGSAKIRER